MSIYVYISVLYCKIPSPYHNCTYNRVELGADLNQDCSALKCGRYCIQFKLPWVVRIESAEPLLLNVFRPNPLASHTGANKCPVISTTSLSHEKLWKARVDRVELDSKIIIRGRIAICSCLVVAINYMTVRMGEKNPSLALSRDESLHHHGDLEQGQAVRGADCEGTATIMKCAQNMHRHGLVLRPIYSTW